MSTYRDPFNGICMHGVDGARFIDGRLASISCENCFPELAHTCPYREEILGDPSLCMCDADGVADCQLAI